MARIYLAPQDDLRQTAYRVYYDDASLQTATPKSNENTAAMTANSAPNRVRIEVKNDALDVGYTLHLLLEYRVNSGGWEPCTTSSAVRIRNSAHYNTGDATLTNRLMTNTANYVQGVGVDTQASAGAINLDVGEHTECEWCVECVGLQAGDVVQFRVVNLTAAWSGDLNNYTAAPLTYDYYPTLTLTGGSLMAIETVSNLTRYGIAVASDETKAYKAVALLDVVSCDVQPRTERIITSAGRGSLSPRRALTSRVWCEGNLTCELTPNHAPYLLMLAGYAPTTAGTGPTYTHTFNLGDGLPTKSGTLVAYHNNGSPPTHEVYAGLVARSMSLEYNAESADTLQLSMDLIGLIYGVSQTTTLTDLFAGATPPADADPPFAQPVCSVQLPDGTAINRIVRAAVSAELQRDVRWTLRGRVFGRGQQPIRALRVTGSLTAVFDSDADLKRALNQTASPPYMHLDAPSAPTTSLRLRANNGLSGNSARRIDVIVPAIVITGVSTPKRRDEAVLVEMEWEAIYDAAQAATLIIEVLNAAAGTTYADATATISGMSL
ncbi:MAG: hypothetical protein D6697_08960 [Armatimonadetes bacterium]|nr:MAG: hypothetical protein D6697_08960 [Armatimonadota bacterium]